MFYTESEIARFAAMQKCSVAEFKTRWVIVNNGACWIFGPSGYRPAVKNALDLAIALKKFLAPVPPSSLSPAGIDWEYTVGAGTKEKTNERIITEYGSLAINHVLDMSIEESRYDVKTETFYERVCPLRKLEPVYDEQVDTWLRYLGGKNAETLLNWCATCLDLSRPSCAIYVHGSKGCGKNMLAEGIARLWGTAPTPIDSLTGNFNSAIVNCPVIFADEEIPKGVTSGFLRSLCGRTSHAFKRKQAHESSVNGCVRLIIAANNPDLLNFSKEDFSVDDINAVAARILYFKCDSQAADYLTSLGGFEGTKDWINADRIAKHMLWLNTTRDVKKGSRFMVEGGLDIVHRNLATNGATRERTVEWICRAMIEFWAEKNPGIRFGGGELFVNASFVQQKWDQILKDPHIPSLKKIGQAFKPLSTGERRLKIDGARGEARRADFYKIDPQFIYDSVSLMQIGDEAEFRQLINRPAIVQDDADVTPVGAQNGANVSLMTSGVVNLFDNVGSEGRSLFDDVPADFSKK